MSLLAGCLGRAEKPPEQPPGNNSDSSIQSVSFDGGEMVIELPDDHDVRRLNLIDAEGELYTQTTVASGETTSRLEILDIRPGLGGYEHYEPGNYELVTVDADGETTSTALELVPDLRIVDISQYRDGERNSDYGKLAVKVENVGTGPTWVYDIRTRGVESQDGWGDFETDPGIPRINKPHDLDQLIQNPDQRESYVSVSTPFLFADSAATTCSGSKDVEIRVDSTAGQSLFSNVSTNIGGELLPVGLVDQYTCSRVSVETLAQSERDESENQRGAEWVY